MVEPLGKMVVDNAHGFHLLMLCLLLWRRLDVRILQINMQFILQQFLDGQRKGKVLDLLYELDDSAALLA